MGAVIRIVGLINGERTPYDDQFVVAYDPERGGGLISGRQLQFYLVTTPDVEHARVFDSMIEAGECWKQISRRQPVRPWDGKPNRPLTAFTVEIASPDRYR